MAKEYDNKNSGVVFPNDRKTSPKHPDFKGSCTIQTPSGELVEYWVSGWEKEGRSGPLMSLSFTLKEDAEERPAKKTSSGGGLFKSRATEAAPVKKKAIEEDLDDSVPF